MAYALYEYRRPDGSFDYDAYVAAQVEAHTRKHAFAWTSPDRIAILAGVVRMEVTPRPAFGLCHGTRAGWEQRWFAEALPGCEVWGTEIAPPAAGTPFTKVWDFHDEVAEWVGRADFVYSNSLDHAYDPEKAVRTWMAQLRPGGVCFIEQERMRGGAPLEGCASDPFKIQEEDLQSLIGDWGFRVSATIRWATSAKRYVFVVRGR